MYNTGLSHLKQPYAFPEVLIYEVSQEKMKSGKMIL